MKNKINKLIRKLEKNDKHSVFCMFQTKVVFDDFVDEINDSLSKFKLCTLITEDKALIVPLYTQNSSDVQNAFKALFSFNNNNIKWEAMLEFIPVSENGIFRYIQDIAKDEKYNELILIFSNYLSGTTYTLKKLNKIFNSYEMESHTNDVLHGMSKLEYNTLNRLIVCLEEL